MGEKEKTPAPENGELKVKKKSELGSLAEGFIEDAGRGLLSYFVNEHLIPFVEKTIRSLADGVLRKLGGALEPSKGQDGVYVKYSKSSSGVKRDRSFTDPFGLDNIILRSKSDAERIKRALEDDILRYRFARVADLYDELEMDLADYPYTANDYGWTSMKGSEIIMVSEGWKLKLPRVISLN